MRLALLLCLIAMPALAGDGTLIWRTLETAHFEMHFPEGLEQVAFRAARIAEEAHAILTPVMDHAPDRRTQVVITDYGDFANGSATALPYPRITLLAAPPAIEGNLGDYDDWLRLLLFHEYVHILQLDNVSGLPALFNQILGKQFAPNQNLPSFQLEGEAVWLESATSGRGRIRSATFRGTLRAQALAGKLPSVDALIHAPLAWPGANVWYMHGGHFFDWLARTRGLQTAGLAHDAMSNQLIPFNLNRAMRAASGETLTRLHAAWEAELTARSQAEAAEVERAGRTPAHALTTTGQRHDNPRFLPDGTLLALHSAEQESYGIWRHPEGGEARLWIELDGAGRFDVCPGGRYLLYDLPQPHQQAYTFYDLFLLDTHTGERRRLTRGARVREGACGPGADWVAAIQIVHGRTRLVRVDTADGRVTVLHDPGGLNQMGFPAVSPDGRYVAATRVSQRSGHDLVLWDQTTSQLLTLTHNDALELAPRFTADGRWLTYASDRTGIFDLYAYHLTDATHHRLTHEINGALDAAVSPDGRRLVYQALTADGTDLAETAFAPGPALAPEVIAEPLRPDVGDAPLPTRPYDATETLWPVAWSPAFSFSSATDAASQLGIEVEAGDAAGHHFLVGNLTTAPDVDGLTASLSYGLSAFRPNLSLNLSHGTQVRANGALHGSLPQDWRETVTSVGGAIGFGFGRVARGASVGMSYAYTTFRGAENPDPVHDPLDRAPLIPEPLNRGSLAVTARYGDLDSTPFAISTEQGRTFAATLRLRHPLLGGDLETAEIFFDYEEFIDLWWRHVLALRVVTAFGRSDSDRRILYALGAPQERNVFLDALDEIFLGSTFLRGYPAGTVQGDRYALFTAEYRLPLLDAFLGPSTVPAFFRRLKLAIFTDWGQADTKTLGLAPSDFKKSIGAELVSEATVGWRLAMNVRVGYSEGINSGGEGQWYFFLGNWF